MARMGETETSERRPRPGRGPGRAAGAGEPGDHPPRGSRQPTNKGLWFCVGAAVRGAAAG
eukprot:scaffold32634_cov42-Phaeocystis_antarctica.AAC.2